MTFLLIVTTCSRSHDTVVLIIWTYLDMRTRDWGMGMQGDSWQSQGNSGNVNLCLNPQNMIDYSYYFLFSQGLRCPF